MAELASMQVRDTPRNPQEHTIYPKQLITRRGALVNVNLPGYYSTSLGPTVYIVSQCQEVDSLAIEGI